MSTPRPNSRRLRILLIALGAAVLALPGASVYYEYSGGETAVGLLDDGVVVVRTFSKAFGLAGARIGYLLAEAELAEELGVRGLAREVWAEIVERFPESTQAQAASEKMAEEDEPPVFH